MDRDNPVLNDEFGLYYRFRDGFAAILDPHFYPLNWLDVEVWSGRAKVFAAADGCLLCEVRRYPGGAVECHVLAATGKLATIMNVLRPEMEAWAAGWGADCIGVASKKAWERLLAPHGYAVWQVELRKEL